MLTCVSEQDGLRLEKLGLSIRALDGLRRRLSTSSDLFIVETDRLNNSYIGYTV